MRYLLGRVVAAVATLWAVTLLVFLAMRLVPGSYAQIALGPLSTEAARERVSSQYKLDDPLPLQYVAWLGRLLRGDLGVSLGERRPVTEFLAQRMEVTLELAALAVAITIIIGMPLAVIAGLARARILKGASRLFGAAAMSTPDFVLGTVLVYLFSKHSLGLSVSGFVPLSTNAVENLRSMLLPAITLAVFGVAIVVRTGRDAVAATMSDPHVTAAVARGESRMFIFRHHVLRNSSIPLVTVLATFVGYMMGGAVVVENLFSLPGIGQGVLNAVTGRDYVIVQGVVLCAATIFVVVNMLADVTYGLIDPRVTRGAGH